MILNRPVRLTGVEAEANYATHTFLTLDDETRCADCDCRPSGATATQPCGAGVRRETVEVTYAL